MNTAIANSAHEDIKSHQTEESAAALSFMDTNVPFKTSPNMIIADRFSGEEGTDSCASADATF